MAPRERRGEEADLLSNLRANAPSAVVKAAKASLKEPSRPYTPADASSSRQLFGSGSDFGQRPVSSYGPPSSKHFYESAPRLPWAKPDPLAVSGSPRSDSMGRSLLGGSPLGAVTSSGMDSPAGTPGSADAHSRLGRTGSRTTAAETVAALKASMGQPDYAKKRQLGQPTYERELTLQQVLAQEDAMAEPGGELLDPHRNDDLPARPSTSRGRPSSALVLEDTVGATSPRGEVPAPIRMGPSAQVLGIAHDASDDDSPDDEAYRHLYTYATPRSTADDAGTSTATAAAAATGAGTTPSGAVPSGKPPVPSGAGAGAGAGVAGSPIVVRTVQRQGSSMSSSSPTAATAAAISAAAAAAAAGASSSRGGGSASSSSSAPASSLTTTFIDPLDPCDPIAPWRAAVEDSLQQLATSTSTFATATGPAQRDAMTDLLRHMTALGAHVEYMRKQPHSSRWLSAPCAHHRDMNTGQPLTIREAVSEHVFRLMDSTNAELLLKGCSIILRVVKSRQPLLQAAKMLYRLSKDTANDSLFRRERLLEPLLRTVMVMVGSSSGPTSSPATSMHEPLVYLNGCMKNISNDATNQRSLVKAGALQVLANVLAQMSSQVDASGPSPAKTASSAPGPASTAEGFSPSSTSDMAGQVAVQVTGVLRNLAVSPAHTVPFTESGVITSLRLTAAALRGQQEVVLNVGRILSKLSLSEECQAIMEADAEYAPLLVALLKQYTDNRAVLLRVAFVLGNLTTNSNVYRMQVAEVPGALSDIVGILTHYAMQAAPPSTSSSDPTQRATGTGAGQGPAGGAAAAGGAGPSSSGTGAGAGAAGTDRLSRSASLEDCIIKMLRLVANLAIHPDVGPLLAQQQRVLDCLLHLLGSYQYADAEELVLNCVCALTNLSFYHGSPDNKILSAEPERLLSYITPLLACDNEEAQVEAARAYGNFSRTHEAREYMQEAKVLDITLTLLDHTNPELLYSICGTLINFTVDSDRKEALVELGGVGRLLEVMERVVTSAEVSELEIDILLVLFKALYNICVDDAAEGEPLSSRPAVSEEEITTIEAIVEHVRAAEEFAGHEEVLALSERLVEQLRQIADKLAALELEPA